MCIAMPISTLYSDTSSNKGREMNLALENMLARYDCSTPQDHENALKEILQEISLLGLWRAKFFERAAFYGGTALRIHYGLDRFSEDLDFSLLEPDAGADFTHYFDAVRSEIAGFGFAATVSEKLRSRRSNIAAGMVRLGLRESLLEIEVPTAVTSTIH